MRTVEMEALSITAEEQDAETLSSGPARPPMPWRTTMLLVAAGGVVGGLLRELIMLLIPTIQTPTLIEVPRASLLVNVLGCVGLGILTGLIEKEPDAPRWLRPLVGIGFLEGFTIYSGVVLDGSAMIGADFPALAFMYGGITLFGAICGVLLGLGLASLLHRRGIRLGALVARRGGGFRMVARRGTGAGGAAGAGGAGAAGATGLAGADGEAAGGAEALAPEADATDGPAPVPSLDAPGDAEVHVTLSSASPGPASAVSPGPASAASPAIAPSPAPRRAHRNEGEAR